MDLWLDRYSSKSGGDPDVKFKREGQKWESEIAKWCHEMVKTFEAAF